MYDYQKPLLSQQVDAYNALASTRNFFTFESGLNFVIQSLIHLTKR